MKKNNGLFYLLLLVIFCLICLCIYLLYQKNNSKALPFIGTQTQTATTVETSLPYINTFPYATAANLTATYNPATVRNCNIYFPIQIADLLNYINDAATVSTGIANNNYMHFLLINDPAIPGNLNLIITSVNNSGDDIYITPDDANYYVLKIGSSPYVPLENNATVTQGVKMNNLMQPLYYTDAITKINLFVNSPSMNTTATSFLVSASDLYKYIYSCNNKGNADYAHIYLGIDNGRLCLIIAGYCSTGGTGGNGAHIYGTDSRGRASIFEHCYPCPECDIYNNGLSIENNLQTSTLHKASQQNNAPAATNKK